MSNMIVRHHVKIDVHEFRSKIRGFIRVVCAFAYDKTIWMSIEVDAQTYEAYEETPIPTIRFKVVDEGQDYDANWNYACSFFFNDDDLKRVYHLLVIKGEN